MLALRPVGQIVAELSTRRREPTAISVTAREALAASLPAGFLSLVDEIGGQEIAGDFMLLNLAQLLRETADRDHPLIALGTQWWVFGTSGTGDAWLLGPTEHGDQVAFLDHDQGTDALSIEMFLDFNQWLQLADLMAQVEHVEQCASGLANVEKITREMNRLSEGLSQRYPYSLDA
ncbi:hypothetical protein WIX39_030710 [Variovorax sp. AB1(2024)]|uniref:hypothetical protein n=1 Tax=Variovorax sp. AB1(2024) TaxID=3132214 RepID=UPI0030B5280D